MHIHTLLNLFNKYTTDILNLLLSFSQCNIQYLITSITTRENRLLTTNLNQNNTCCLTVFFDDSKKDILEHNKINLE